MNDPKNRVPEPPDQEDQEPVEGLSLVELATEASSVLDELSIVVRQIAEILRSGEQESA